jgi:type II secretion system protein I
MTRRGITLYEVVLALAIFAGSVAAISQGIATGTRAALQSRLQSQAILLCETKMGEILAGVLPPTSTSGAAFLEPGLDGWQWSSMVTQGPRTGLMRVEVTVTCHRAAGSVDASFALIRLVRDQMAFVTSATEAANQQQQQQQQQTQQAH